MQQVVFKLPDGRQVALRMASGKYLGLVASASTVQSVEWVSDPALTGTGKIGSALTVVAGVYLHASSVKRDLIRTKNGVSTVIVANIANGATYTPVSADNRATLSLREVAEGGNITLTTPSDGKAITWPAPTLAVLPALGPFEQGSGIQTVDLAGYATGGGLEWSITGPAGIEIEDGLTTIPTTLTQAAAAATVTIQNSGGSAQRSTTITITDKRPASSGVDFNTLSFVQGASSPQTFDASVGFVGSNMTFSLPGAPAGVTISTTGVISVQTGSLISLTTLTIRATNGGGSFDRSISLEVVAPSGIKPGLSGTQLPDKLGLIRGTTASTQPTALAFTGTVTQYLVTGAGVTINSTTGVMTFAKAATQAQQTVTVTASNAYGSASVTFQMSCVMQVLKPADFDLIWITDKTGQSDLALNPPYPLGAFTWHIDINESALPEPVNALWWRPDAHVAGTGPGTGYHPCVRLSPQPAGLPTGVKRWIMRRCTPVTGAPMISAWLNVVDTLRVGRDVVHNFIWSASPANLNPLTQMEFSGPMASDLTQKVVLTGAPAIAADPKLGVTLSVTISQATPAVVTKTAHGLSNADKVWFDTTDTLPAPLVRGTEYFVVNKATNTFQVSATSGGTALATTSAGAGTHTCYSTRGLGDIGTEIGAFEGAVSGDPAPTESRSFKIGTATTAASTTKRYTPVDADRNKALIYSHSAVSTGGVVTRSAPSLNLGKTVAYTPKTKTEFATAMNNAVSGDVIEIPGGDKGDWKFTSATAKNRSGIIVRAQDRGNRPVFDDAFLNLTNWNGISFQYLDFQCTAPDVRTTYGPLCILLYGCNNIAFRGCYFKDYFGAIETHDGGDNHEWAYNTVEGTRCDAFRLYNIGDSLWAHHNKIWKPNVNTSWTVDDDRHCDMFQMAATSVVSTNAVFEDNYGYSDQVDFANSFHGIFALSERWSKSGLSFDTWSHKNFTARRNFFRGVNAQGITLGGVKGGTVSDNYMDSPTSNLNIGNCPSVYFLKVDKPYINGDPKRPNPNYGDTGVQNCTVTNNAWPLQAGQKVLKYGNGDIAGLGGNSVSANLIAPGSQPVGWSSFDASDPNKVGHLAAAA